MKQRGKSPLKPPAAKSLSRAMMKKPVSKQPETEEHAREVRAVVEGRDSVDTQAPKTLEEKPARFQNADLLFVRSWLGKRPLEPAPQAASLVPYPRMWATKRGRYCRFRAPGAGVYALLRARPTF